MEERLIGERDKKNTELNKKNKKEMKKWEKKKEA